jgi:GDP-L-fucose synthase
MWRGAVAFTPEISAQSRIYVAGHRGLVGSAIVRHLNSKGHGNPIVASSAELDLRDQQAVNRFFAEHRPEYVFCAAAKVGGILANATRPAEFIYDNLAIQTNVIDAARRNGTRKFLFLGSSCIYPRLAPQPIREESLLTGSLEPTNEAYAIAKIAGLKMAQAYRAQYGFPAIGLMPTNLYGPGDNFDPATSHVLPAMIQRFHQAKISGAEEVVLWGTGTPRREFLHVDDLAAAAVFAMEHYDGAEPLNTGTGEDLTIAELAGVIARIVGYRGAIRFDPAKPDGTPRKLLDVTRFTELGWRAGIRLEDGIASTYAWYLERIAAPVTG